MELNVFGVNVQGLLEMWNRLVEPSLLQQSDTKIVVSVALPGVYPQGHLEVGNRLVDVPLPQLGEAKIAVQPGVSRIEF